MKSLALIGAGAILGIIPFIWIILAQRNFIDHLQKELKIQSNGLLMKHRDRFHRENSK